jgi:hypothetical protein
MERDKMILNTSGEAATYRTDIAGWVSRDGLFFGKDERTARYSGCTHLACADCGVPVPKNSYTVCRPCRETRDLKRYLERERKPYEGGMVYSDSEDRYFESLDEALEYAEDEGKEPDDLRLLLCTPNHVRPLESDYCCDELPEDGDLPSAIEEAMEAFNEAVKGIVVSWSPGKYAIDLKGR